MQQEAPSSFLSLVRKALRPTSADDAPGALPLAVALQQVDLIHRLNELERIDAERQPDTPKRPQSH